MSRARRLFTALIVTVLVAAVVCVVHQSRVAIECERTFQAELLVLFVLSDYVDEHGEWPTGWSSLEGTQGRAWGGWVWPDDSVAIQERIRIDFDFDVCAHKPLLPRTFRGIEPTKLSFARGDEWLDSLRRIENRLCNGR